MGCFFGCSGNNNNSNNNNNNNNNINSNKKKRSENPNHNPEESFNSNYNINIADESAVNVNEETKEVNGTASRAVDVSVGGETNSCSKARTFTYQELVDATENFRSDFFLGEGGFGKVYKGKLLDTSEVVAIKRLDRSGTQGIREFVVEVMTLSLADHPNLVKLIGYCAEGNHRLLVYEYMALGSLDTHLHDLRPNKKALDWNTRMAIAAGVAKGLEYLHDKMKPSVIYRDVKCSNILLGEGYNTKLSDFGLAKVGPLGDKTHVSTRVMGTYGYCAPEYAMTGRLTFRSDIYSFGVVLLEIITGRKAIYNTKGGREKNLVAWAKPFFQDRRKLFQMADPALQGQFPMRGLYKALALAAMCVQERSQKRPLIAQVVISLEFLSNDKYDPLMHTPNHRRASSYSSIKKDSRNSKKLEIEDSQSKNDSEDYKTGKRTSRTSSYI